MTELLEQPRPRRPSRKTIEKVSIVISKGSLEGIYPGLIMANGARMEGIEANLFFTFFGLDAIRKDRHEQIKVATVGNPGMHMPTLLGALPACPRSPPRMMKRQMEKLDIPPIPEFIELIADSGAGLYACKATRRHVRPDRWTTSSPRSTTSSPSASSTSRPPAARSSSPEPPISPNAAAACGTCRRCPPRCARPAAAGWARRGRRVGVAPGRSPLPRCCRACSALRRCRPSSGRTRRHEGQSRRRRPIRTVEGAPNGNART